MPQNDTFDWLTYETIFQQKRFSRTNSVLKMGLYSIPREKVTVFFRNDLPGELLTILTEAFFPDEADVKKHLERSNLEWPWKKPVAIAVASTVTPTLVTHSSSPDTNKLHLPSYVVLPYNHLDNRKDSNALGTNQVADYGLRRLNEDYQWRFWKTASRSSVVRLTPIVKTDSQTWNKRWQADYPPWDFAAGDAARREFSIPKETTDSRYRLKNYNSYDFSLKTGVIFVGSEDQKLAQKDNLDSNWVIACLRSDYVVEVDKTVARDKESFTDDILVLTELLSINEVKERGEGKDGIQVRDISLLDKTKIYYPPLSIPMTDLTFNKVVSEFLFLDDKEWCDFWKQNYAASLGKAKALFALRYGLQHTNPNVQNYLIEFEKKEDGGLKPTGRIVIRDLQDAALQREIVWALYGGKKPLPKGEGEKAQLKELVLPVLKYEFEGIPLADAQETGSTEKKFGNPGLHFLWQRFSMFGGNGKYEAFVKRMYGEGNEETFTKFAKSNFEEANRLKKEIKRITDEKLDEIPGQDRNNFDLYSKTYDKAAAEAEKTYPDTALQGRDGKILGDIGAALRQVLPNMAERNKMKRYFDGIKEATADKVEKLKVEEENLTNAVIKRLLHVMSDWGNAHNLAYVRCFEKQLGVNFEINWDSAPRPDRFLTIKISRPEAEREMKWEEEQVKVIQKFLEGDEGQAVIVNYQKSGWKPSAPLFRIKVSDSQGKPVKNHFVKIKHLSAGAEKIWTDITDESGEIPLYQGKEEEYSVFADRKGIYPAGDSDKLVSLLSIKNIFRGVLKIDDLRIECIKS